MKKVQQSQAYLRKRKMMLVLPLLVIPFLTMAFWALGGGQVRQNITTAKQPGLNLNLPDAGMKDDDLKAIYAYMKTIAPITNKVEKYPK